MSIIKYRTFAEAEKALWVTEPDSEYFINIRDLFNTAKKLNPIKYPHGLFYYKTLEDAHKQRQKWELDYAVKKINK